jgi:hypothetical protein
MRREFCTLFDAHYLPRGLVLYRSLSAVCPDFQLRVFCMDDATQEILDALALPRVVPIELRALEAHDTKLRDVKPTRTRVEYCWTATPAVCLFSLEREPELEMITYLDADLRFFGSPEPIFTELADSSVLITPHRAPRRWRGWAETNSTYNVQFMTFRNDRNGLTALRWWRERCLEWCHQRLEDGKFGDQKYLDDWPTRFVGVHVLEHPGAGVAPWNAMRYAVEERDSCVVVDGVPVIFYHYQSLRLYHRVTTLRRLGLLPDAYEVTDGPSPLVWSISPEYELSEPERRLIWHPYLRELRKAIIDIRRVDPSFRDGFVDPPLRQVARDVLRRVLPPPAWRLLSAGRRRALAAFRR